MSDRHQRSTHSHSQSHSRSHSKSNNNGNGHSNSNSRSNSSSHNKPPSSSVPKPSSRVSDAEYARRLQEEYRREFLQRRATAPVEDPVGHRSNGFSPMSVPPPPPVAPVAPRMVPSTPSPRVTPTPVYSNMYTNPYPSTNTNTRAMDDEAYARRLQLEMEEADRLMEEARRSSRSQQRYEITPVSNTRQPFDEVELECHYHDEEEDLRLARQVQDEELARQLAAQPPTPTTHHAHSAHHTRRPPSRSNSSSRHRSSSTNRHATGTDRQWEEPVAFQHAPSKPRTASTSSDASSDEMARRIAQEMDDAEMAQRLSLYEQETMAQQARQPGRKRGIWYLFLARVLPLLCCGSIIAVALLFILGVFDPQNVPFVGDILGGDGWVDPFKGDVAAGGNDGSVPVVAQNQAGWSSDGRSGVSVEIVNACEDKWTDFINTAVQNWDNGFPLDPLTLSISRASYDPVCEAITGKIKVCNADYGDTRWRGLNELMLNKQTNTIVSSAAKMNEFYLLTESDDQKLYTMCHELGHGFGLPHWDEDFFNSDMGTCMDYTNNPGANKKPDASNFLFLAQIYGGVNITTGEAIPASAVMTGDEEGPRTQDTDSPGTGTSAQDTPQTGDRRVEGMMMVNAIPSKVILSEMEQRRPRRILITNDFFEVHHVDEINDEMVKIQIYLLA